MGQQLLLFDLTQPRISKYNFFLALFPDCHAAEHIAEIGEALRRKHGTQKRLRPRSHLHVSLHCLGDESVVQDFVVAILDRTCKTVAAETPPFEVELNHALSFCNRSGNYPFVLVDDDRRNEVLSKFYQSLEAQLVKDRLTLRPNTRFVPHVTLLYDQKIHPKVRIDPITWKVEEIVLVRSEVGATKYQWVARWALGR